MLCTDKTGTLIENRMVIRRLYSGGQMLQVDSHSDLPEPWHELVEFGILASERAPFDPMERALHELGNLPPWAPHPSRPKHPLPALLRD